MHPFAHRPLLCVQDAYVFASNCQTLLGKQSDVQSDAWPECAKEWLRYPPYAPCLGGPKRKKGKNSQPVRHWLPGDNGLMAEVLELPRGTHTQLSPHFAKKGRNKLHGGGFMVIVLRVLPKMLEKVQESSSALRGIGLFIQVEICARLHTKNSALIILHMPKQVPAPVLRNLKEIASANATQETVGNIPVSEEA